MALSLVSLRLSRLKLQNFRGSGFRDGRVGVIGFRFRRVEAFSVVITSAHPEYTGPRTMATRRPKA